MPTGYTEDALIEQPAIALFGEIGWEAADCFHEFEQAGGSPLGRETPAEVVLVSRLQPALEKLNPDLPAEAITKAIEELTRDRSVMTAVNANRDIYRLLKDGVKVESANVPLTRTLSQGERASHHRGGFDRAGLVKKARELRQRQTPAEDVMWEMLRDRRFMGLKFRRQHQMGDYIADFYCDEAKLVVELDGSIHDKQAKRQHDAKRDQFLRGLGLTVIHIQNKTVLDDPDAALAAIQAVLPSMPASSCSTGGMTSIPGSNPWWSIPMSIPSR